MTSENFTNNRQHMAKHPSQGSARRVLCVCSGGLLRSPTAAKVLGAAPYNYNTRSAGITPKYALIPVDQVLVDWAEEIVCMDEEHHELLKKNFKLDINKIVKCLNLGDDYTYMDPTLIEEIRSRYDEC